MAIEDLQKLPDFVDDPLHKYAITLDGRQYVLKFDYNGRCDRWILTIKDAQERNIVAGVKITNGWNVLKRVLETEGPPGVLAWLDVRGLSFDPPGFAELGRRIVGAYAPETSTQTST